MITWMQKHRKMLVVVLWITVIAFVGAGFVGWGSYQYGSKAANIAKVGDVEISVGQYQRTYQNLHGYYNQLFEGNLPDAQAKELEQMALNSLINQAYLLNLAKEAGISIGDDEVAREIMSTEVFFKDGVFDKALYENALNDARLRMSEYEQGVHDDLLVKKVMGLFDYGVEDLELKALGATVFVADKLHYTILDADQLKVALDDASIKEYWEKNQARYMGEPTYDVAYIEVKADQFSASKEDAQAYFNENQNDFLNEEGALKDFDSVANEAMVAVQMKQARKAALKKRLELKKGKVEATIANGMAFGNEIVPAKGMALLDAAKAGEVLKKPVEREDGYVVVKLIARYDAKPLTYTEAMPLARTDYLNDARTQALEAQAKEMLNGFKGEYSGFVTRNDVSSFEMLTPNEATLFLNNVFGSKQKRAYVNLGSKAIVYEVVEQKLFDEEKFNENKKFIVSNTERLKGNLVESSLIEYLKTRYPVEKFYEGI